MLTDAISPSNFLLSNPAALREAMQTHGESLVKGMENFAADLAARRRPAVDQPDRLHPVQGRRERRHRARQGGLPERADRAPAVRSDHGEVCEIPLLIFPPWINKFYILDLRPENSMIRWLTSQGITVFVASWVNPDAALAEKTFEDYLQRGHLCGDRRGEAPDRRRATSTPSATASAAPCSPARWPTWPPSGDKRIASATFFAAQQDFSRGRRPACSSPTRTG